MAQSSISPKFSSRRYSSISGPLWNDPYYGQRQPYSPGFLSVMNSDTPRGSAMRAIWNVGMSRLIQRGFVSPPKKTGWEVEETVSSLSVAQMELAGVTSKFTELSHPTLFKLEALPDFLKGEGNSHPARQITRWQNHSLIDKLYAAPKFCDAFDNLTVSEMVEAEEMGLIVFLEKMRHISKGDTTIEGDVVDPFSRELFNIMGFTSSYGLVQERISNLAASVTDGTNILTLSGTPEFVITQVTPDRKKTVVIVTENKREKKYQLPEMWAEAFVYSHLNLLRNYSPWIGQSSGPKQIKVEDQSILVVNPHGGYISFWEYFFPAQYLLDMKDSHLCTTKVFPHKTGYSIFDKAQMIEALHFLGQAQKEFRVRNPYNN